MKSNSFCVCMDVAAQQSNVDLRYWFYIKTSPLLLFQSNVSGPFDVMTGILIHVKTSDELR